MDPEPWRKEWTLNKVQHRAQRAQKTEHQGAGEAEQQGRSLS